MRDRAIWLDRKRVIRFSRNSSTLAANILDVPFETIVEHVQALPRTLDKTSMFLWTALLDDDPKLCLLEVKSMVMNLAASMGIRQLPKRLLLRMIPFLCGRALKEFQREAGPDEGSMRIDSKSDDGRINTMSDIKFRKMEQFSGWIEYKLKTGLLDPPTFRCRLRPIDMLNMIDGIPADGTLKVGRMTVEAAIDSVAEWDLAENGVPIPVTAETKAGYLRPILAEPLEDGTTLLGIAILLDAQKRENFLKN